MPASTDRFHENVVRVRNLLDLYDQLGNGRRGRRLTHVTDILRAAVVLLHASLEEFLREVDRERLPQAGSQALNVVPVSGTGPRLERFQLGALTPFRGQTIDELIATSVAEHLERSNWNNNRDIINSLRMHGIDTDGLQVNWGGLAQLMERRHHIVHQTDRNPVVGRGRPRAQPISAGTVSRWTADVERFVNEVSLVLQPSAP